jgi:hypothetical protein
METALEKVLMTFNKEKMILFMDSHPEAFEEAIKLSLLDKQPHSWRAAWLLWSFIEENDKRIQKHIKEIINAIESKKDGHQRELLKILLKMNLNKKHEGFLFDLCMNLWEQINKDPSVRITAFKFIVKMAKKIPELSKEISFLTQDHYLETLSPGVKNSLSKMMKDLVL